MREKSENAVVLLDLLYIVSKVGSLYGKPKKTIHLTNVICSGDEHTLTECTSTQLSVLEGKLLLHDTEVAGVDCTGMTSNVPPCFTSHDVVSSNTCNTKGSVRLIHNGMESTSEGRVEYCTGQYWTPLCTMDNKIAAVTCRQLGHTQYQCEYRIHLIFNYREILIWLCL